MFNPVALQTYTAAQVAFIRTVADDYGIDPALCDLVADYIDELAALAA